MYLENILPFAHHLLRGRLKNGDAALDGTAGNGHDTLLLAQCVGGGKVWAFDVQPQALQQTRRRLEEAGVSAELICDGHEKLADYVDRPLCRRRYRFWRKAAFWWRCCIPATRRVLPRPKPSRNGRPLCRNSSLPY